MKKITVLLALVITLVALASINVFADVQPSFGYADNIVYYTEGSIDFAVYPNEDADLDLAGVTIEFANKDLWTVTNFASDYSEISVPSKVTSKGKANFTSGLNSVSVSTDKALAKFTATPVADVNGTTIKLTFSGKLDGNTISYVETITVEKAEVVVPDPVPSVAAGAVDGAGKEAAGYTDVPTFTGSVAVENAAYLGSKKVMLTPSVYADGELHKTYDAVNITGLTIDESGNIAFKLAVIGAPEDVVVTASATAALVD